MEGSFGKNALGIPCRGKSPWLPIRDDPHSTPPPRVLQRGASNLYFAATVSALDIPPWSDRFQRGLEDCWDQLVWAKATDDFRRMTLESRNKPELLGIPIEEILRIVHERISLLEKSGVQALRREEYQQFTTPILSEIDDDSEFEVRPEIVPPEVSHWIGHLVRATRLREVRALRGFTRIRPPPELEDDGRELEDDGRDLCAISAERKNWLPGVEVRGEGIFVALNLTTLRAWEERHPVLSERIRRISAAHQEDGGGLVAGAPEVTRRTIVLHSLAHTLIRQLSLECGYSSASLRERIYVSPPGPGEMAGFLLYTAASDADGTLGGLSRQGRPGPFLRLLDAALRSIEWCSSDPLCIEGTTSLSEPTNAAACHSCLLAAETSCELFNRFLDRATLVGIPTDRSSGYFHGFSA